MPDFPLFSDLFRIARDEALARNGKLAREVVERQGSDANIALAGSAAVGDEVVNQLTQVSAGMFLDSARGQLLDRVILDRYGLPRKSAAASRGSVTFSTTAPAVAAFAIPAGTVVQAQDGVQFETIASTVFPIGATSIAPVPVRSLLAGSSLREAIGTITNIISVIPGAASDLAVTNALATGGDDADEEDADYRARGRAFFSTVAKATRRAIEQGALAVGGVRTAVAFEVLDALGRPARYVALIITDAFSNQIAQLSTIPPTYQQQSQQLAASVFNGLDDVRACGIYVQVLVAQVILQAWQLNLSFTAGVDVDSVALQARAAIVNYTNALPAGTNIDPAAALAALRLVPGLVISGNEIVSPPGVVVAKPLQALRTTLAIVSAVSANTSTPLLVTNNPDAFV